MVAITTTAGCPRRGKARANLLATARTVRAGYLRRRLGREATVIEPAATPPALDGRMTRATLPPGSGACADPTCRSRRTPPRSLAGRPPPRGRTVPRRGMAVADEQLIATVNIVNGPSEVSPR